MKKKLIPFTKSKHYNDFKSPLNHALERVLHHHLSAVDQIIGKLKKKISYLVENAQIAESFRKFGGGPIKQELHLATVQTERMVRRLRGEVYLLAHAGEVEAMSRAMGKPLHYHAFTIPHRKKEAPSGGDLLDRMMLYFDRLSRDIQDAIQLSHVVGESPKKRVMATFPKTRHIKHTPGLTKRKLKEAESPGVSQVKWVPKMSVGITDDDQWDEILEDYYSTTLPDSIFKRGPEDKTIFYDVDTLEKEERYTWEVEQEITEDFVRSVRSGEQDAAKAQGIEDFMWIAVTDARTDECCFERDGFSSSEIENMLEEGKLDDECDAIVPPAHFNCRCSSAPMTDDLPESVGVDYGSFDDWLNSNVGDE